MAKISFNPVYPFFEKSYLYVPNNKMPYKYVYIGLTLPAPRYEICRKLPTDPFAERINIIEYVLEGEGEILVNGAWYPAQAGDVFVIRSDQDQFYRANKKNPWKKIWFNYYAEYLDGFMDAYGIDTGVYSNTNTLEYFETALKIAKEQYNHSDASYTVADCIHKIIQALSVATSASAASIESTIREELDNAVYQKTTLEEIAQKLHLSRSTTIRTFKKKYGITPYDYLIQRKIETAKMLLRKTSLSSKEISSKLCFSNEHYFSTLFLKHVGMRPSEYRCIEVTK